jgi:hypothetical protein
MSGVQITGKLDLSERKVLGVLDQEAQRSVRAATRLRATAINAAAPVGPTRRLSRSHKPSVRKTPVGYQGRVRRSQDAWYGAVVERGRSAGRSKRTGRAYPAARANPFVDRVDAGISDEAEQLLAAGAERAASQIEARL